MTADTTPETTATPPGPDDFADLRAFCTTWLAELAQHGWLSRRLLLADGSELDVSRLSAALDELKKLRDEHTATAALADEFQDAELCDKVARSEWLHDRISRHETLGPAGRLADERLNETQARLCAAQDAWMAAAVRYRTIQPDAAPQQPEDGDRG